MTQYKYLKMFGCAIVVLMVLSSLPAAGQYSRAPKVRMTPRAVGVLEIDARGKARLFPVMVMIEGKMYDATYYASKPVPLALYSETVYEGQKSGMPMGLFTIDLARRLVNLWWGEGSWKPFNAAKEDKKKGTAKDVGQKNAAAAKPALKDDGDSDRPTLKKPKQETPPPPAEAKPSESQQSARAEDPDRPTLRRGKPAEVSTPTRDEPYETVDPKEKPLAGTPVETLVAISDPVPTDNRPFDMMLSPNEQANLGKEATQQAWAELRKYAAGRLTFAKDATFTNVNIRAYDLDYSNNPLVVFTAEYTVPAGAASTSGGVFAKPLTYYVAYAGKVDLEGRLNKLYATATDSMHLDAYSRMEFIDAVDADGDSRGELLFRSISDIDRKYVIFRATPYWSKMFEGASGQ